MTAQTITIPLPLQVDEIGERCRYYVHSEAKPRNIYVVDLLSNDGIGECTCKWFATTLWPAIRDGKMKIEDTFPVHPCKHLQAAREHFQRDLYRRMAAMEQEKTP
jgi:hypothetical protein